MRLGFAVVCLFSAQASQLQVLHPLESHWLAKKTITENMEVKLLGAQLKHGREE